MYRLTVRRLDVWDQDGSKVGFVPGLSLAWRWPSSPYASSHHLPSTCIVLSKYPFHKDTNHIGAGAPYSVWPDLSWLHLQGPISRQVYSLKYWWARTLAYEFGGDISIHNKCVNKRVLNYWKKNNEMLLLCFLKYSSQFSFLPNPTCYFLHSYSKSSHWSLP